MGDVSGGGPDAAWCVPVAGARAPGNGVPEQTKGSCSGIIQSCCLGQPEQATAAGQTNIGPAIFADKGSARQVAQPGHSICRPSDENRGCGWLPAADARQPMQLVPRGDLSSRFFPCEQAAGSVNAVYRIVLETGHTQDIVEEPFRYDRDPVLQGLRRLARKAVGIRSIHEVSLFVARSADVAHLCEEAGQFTCSRVMAPVRRSLDPRAIFPVTGAASAGVAGAAVGCARACSTTAPSTTNSFAAW